MNCQEPPECRCCDECIKLQNERFRRNNYQQSYAETSPPSQSRRNVNYCDEEGYSARPEKHSSGRLKFSPHCQSDCDQKQWVDSNTLKTLSSLRERACKFLETSDGTRTGDEDQCRPYTRMKESHPYESPTKKQTQNINYEPQSNFLRKMKRKNDVMSESDTYPPTSRDCAGYPHERTYAPQVLYPSSMRSTNGYTSPTIQPSGQYVSERATQYSDASSAPDQCTCYKTWRPKSPEEECVDGADLVKQYNDLCRELSEFRETLEAGNEGCDEDEDEEEEASIENESRKCKHVSRSVARLGRKSKRGSARSAKPCQASENDFEPSLKKPHPNSCDRCWRYASPSRSPVNKPRQRFDPNYRKSHSDIYLNANGKGKGAQGVGGRETNSSCDERETKVHQLMTHPASSPKTGATKSSEDFGRGHGSKSFPTDQSADINVPKLGKVLDGTSGQGNGGINGTAGGAAGRGSGGINGSGGGSTGRGRGGINGSGGGAGGLAGSGINRSVGGRGNGGISGTTGGAGGRKEQSKTDDSNMKKSHSRGDGRSLSVNFEDRAPKKGDPVQSSPSMFDKNGQKSGKKPVTGRRPSTSENFNSGTKLKKPSKSKTVIGSQTSAGNLKSAVKPRSQYFEREVHPPCSMERTTGASTCAKHPSCKPPTLETQHRPDCPCKQKAAYDTARGGFPRRPDTAGPSCCMCKSVNYQQDSSRRGSATCPRHGSDGTSRREITSNSHHCGTSQFCRTNSPSSPSRTSRDGPSIPASGSVNAAADGKKCGCRNHRSSASRPTENRSGSAERQNNPRKYCVFYMNKTKLNRAHDVEVLIEELTQGKSSKDSVEEALKEKMKKVKGVRGDSMALRFQKGIAEGCQRPESNRVLYF